MSGSGSWTHSGQQTTKVSRGENLHMAGGLQTECRIPRETPPVVSGSSCLHSGKLRSGGKDPLIGVTSLSMVGRGVACTAQFTWGLEDQRS